MHTPNIVVGCSELPPRLNRKVYFGRFGYVESRLFLERKPKPGAWAGWVADAKGKVGLVAPAIVTHHHRSRLAAAATVPEAIRPKVGHLADEPWVRAHVRDFAARAQEIAAPAVIFRTPSDFTPSAQHRARLEHFFTEVAPASMFGHAARVWWPDGLWEPGAIVAVCKQLGLVPCLNPLAVMPEQTAAQFAGLDLPSIYLRPRGMGATGRLREGEVETCITIAQTYPRAFLVFAGDNSLREAMRASSLLGEQA